MAFFAKAYADDVQKLSMHSDTEFGRLTVAAKIDPKQSIMHYQGAEEGGLYQYINQEDVMDIQAEGDSYQLVSRQRPDLTVRIDQQQGLQTMELHSLNSYFKKGDSKEAFLSDILIRLEQSQSKELTGTLSFYYEGQYKTYPLVSVVSESF
jgi:hypothetical protein